MDYLQGSSVESIDELSIGSGTSLWLCIGSCGMVLFLLANAKTLPGVWHLRLFWRMAYHLLFQPTTSAVTASHYGARVLFQSVITNSQCPLLECDYNVHKSNSTFFAELDLSRVELILTLFKPVLSPPKPSKSAGVGGTKEISRKTIALGGVSCTFKRQIRPFEKYEIWSRVLCWDQKWLYIVSHFVERGSGRPTSYTLRAKVSGKNQGPGQVVHEQSEHESDKHIFASSIAKYVFKSGRQTVPPEDVLLELGLVPSKPVSSGEKGEDGDIASLDNNEEAIMKAKEQNHWSWQQVQQECQKGLKVAEHFAALDLLHGTWSGSSGPALTRY